MIGQTFGLLTVVELVGRDARFLVSESNIRMVLQRKTWRDV